MSRNVPCYWLLLAGVMTLTAWSAGIAEPAAEGEQDIVVTGRPPAEVRSFVRQVTRSVDGGQLARWAHPVCVRLDNFADGPEEHLSARMRELATVAGVQLRTTGCLHPDVIVVANGDSDDLTRRLLRGSTGLLGDQTATPTSRRARALALTVPRPVRWFTVAESVSRDGVPQSDANQAGAPVTYAFSSSLIASPTRSDLRSELIIVDTVRVAGVTMRQLADYIVFVTLASPAIEGDYRHSDTILSLFGRRDGGAPAGLTGLDVAYLKALYTTPASRTASEQRAAINGRITSQRQVDARE